MPITIYPGSMKKRNANGSYSDLVPAIATDPEVLDDFAEEYSTSETYNIGDYCIHNSDLYKCNTNNTTGTWNNNVWDRVSVADELSDHKNTLTQLDTEVNTVENGLAIPQTGNTASRSIPAGAFIYLTGNTNNLADGIYQNTSGSAIGSGVTFTLSNLTKCYQDTGALNVLKSGLVDYIADEALVTTNIASATKTYTLPTAGLYLILVRGNANNENNSPSIEITDSSGITAKQQGSAGGSVAIHKLVAFTAAGKTVTVNVANFTGGGSYTDYNRCTILRLNRLV